VRRLIALVLVAGCASAGAPPGGAERHTPPEIVSVTPDSGDTNVKAKSVEFQFDEVVSDRPASSATGLDQLFLLSPRNGNADVSWHRSRISVRSKNGFRPNTAYRVTMLPGLTDLRGNVRKEAQTIIFSTGPTFPPFGILGRVFDWAAQRPASGAYVEAVSRADTSVVYVAATDTTGQFDVGPLPAGEYAVRALIDQNSNRIRDRNEKWDSVAVTVSTVRPVIELDAIERDTTPAFIESASRIDSVTLRVTFDKALDPTLPLQPALVRVQRADSSQLEVTGVQWQSAYEQAQQAKQAQAADSARRADSTRRADSARVAPKPAPTAVVPTPGAAGRTPPPQPKPRIPPPDRGIVVTVSPSTPLVPGAYIVTARGMRNLLGRSRDATRTFTVVRPPPRDSTARARPDSARRPPGTPPPRPPRPPR
jgi:uncharacterized protein (DUF2141 family)